MTRLHTLALLALFVAPQIYAAEFQLKLRSREETAKNPGRFHTVLRSESWKPSETAVIVCDMWDFHHCLNATKRGAEMAPRMDKLLAKARSAGAIIIHAPSSCMKFYADHPARKRAQDVLSLIHI